MKCLIIAEAGVNHGSSIQTALDLVDVAVEAKADFVKFQTAVPEEVVSKHARMAPYQVKNIGHEESQLEMTRKLHLKLEDFLVIRDYCKHQKIGFMSTAFDKKSLEFIISLELDVYKIPSGEITNLPYLREIGKINRPLILSTGMSSMKEIGTALEVLIRAGTNKEKISVLQCTTEYPAPFQDLNLRAMIHIKDTFQVNVGFSDHSTGISASIAAVALGAKVVEKHFTLNREAIGPDHKASLEPGELKKLVKEIRNVEASLGDGIKRLMPCEEENIYIARKSLVAAKKIKIGDIFSEVNLTTKRPGHGMTPMLWEKLIGRCATKNYKEDDLIEEEV